MSRSAAVILGCLALALPGCYAVDNFAGDPTDYDGLYFGPSEGSAAATVRDDKWRIYAVWGLVAYSSDATRWAGDRLSRIDPARRPMKMFVTNEMTFLNGLAAAGVSLLLGPLQPLVFVPRTTAIAAR